MKNFPIRLLNNLLLAVIFTLTACSEDDRVNESGSIEIRFNAVWQTETLEILTRSYNHAPGGDFIIDDFKYYLSNIRLIHSESGAVHQDEEGYYLIHKDKNYTDYSIEIPAIPLGKYDRIEFSIGVDPVRNLSIDNVGDLDPNNQMAWNWNIGYKFMLLEGLFTNEAGTDIPLVFHIGGDANYRTYILDLPAEMQISKNNRPILSLETRVHEFFENPNTIDFNSSNTIKHSPEASSLADNYGTGMFLIKDVE